MAKHSTVKHKRIPSFRECLKQQRDMDLVGLVIDDLFLAKNYPELFFPSELHLLTTYRKEFEAWLKLQQ